MKKIKLLLSLFSCFTAFTGTYAETVATSPVQDGSATIADGYYTIRLNKKLSGGGTKYNYIYTNATNSRLEWKKIETSAVDESYIWKVTSTSDGNYSLKNISTQCYANGTGAPSGSGSATITTSTSPANFQITYLGKSEDALNSGEHQYKITITSNSATLFCEWANGESGNLVNFPGGLNSEAGWCFEKVTDQTAAAELDQQIAEQTSIITITKEDEKGSFKTIMQPVAKGQEYTFDKNEAFYTFVSATVDGVETTAASFTPTAATHNIVYKYIYNLPFESSNINGSFPEGTHWYLMKIRGNQYVKYNSGDQTKIPSKESKGIGDEYWWTFTGNYADGIKVYNKAAGPDKVLTAVNSSTNPYIGVASESDGTNEYWTLYPSSLVSNENGFFLSRKGEGTKLNDVSGTLGFYSGADKGSTFTLVSIEDELTPYEKYGQEGFYAVGTLKDEFREQFTTNYNAKSPEGLRAIIELAKSENLIAFSTDKAYRLTTPGRTQKNYMTMNANFLTGTDYNAKNASLIWKFAGDADNGYTMSCQGRYAVEPQSTEKQPTGTSQQAPSTDDVKKASLFKLNAISNKAALWGIKPNNDGLHLDGSFNIVGWTNGDASEWYLVEATTIDLEITEAGYATVKYPFAVQVTDGVTAYTGTADAVKEVFTLNKIENGIIPANTPVVLEGAKGTHTLDILADNNDPALESGLEGTLLSENIESTTNAYILGNGTKGIGFYQMDGTDRTLAANKAYLVLSQDAKGIRSIIFSDGTTTGIESTVAEGAEAEEYYDLQGRRVMNPTKGIYVTKSGKKVLFNK